MFCKSQTRVARIDGSLISPSEFYLLASSFSSDQDHCIKTAVVCVDGQERNDAFTFNSTNTIECSIKKYCTSCLFLHHRVSL